MLDLRTRALLDRYSLSSRNLSRSHGERASLEPGQSVEFHDFRPYQPGDELRYVDWRAYARTGRLTTRLYQAERSVRLHLVLDTTRSMGQGGKLEYARTLVRLLSYVAQRDAPTQLHVLHGGSTPRSQGRRGMLDTWRFLDAAPLLPAGAGGPLTGLVRFAAALPRTEGRSLVIVVSDLLEEVPIEPSLVALRSRHLDAAFLQVLGAEELDPPVGRFELEDVETGERLTVGPDEANAYREEVRRYLKRVRGAVLRTGYRHQLLVVPSEGEGSREREALAALIRQGVLVKR